MTSFIDRYLFSQGRIAARQGATPVPDNEGVDLPEGERTYTMFIQTARSGTWEPKPGEEGTYTLTLRGIPAQTVYFSERPSRIVGTQSTSEFLSMLGFGADNPPNAALVTKADDGQDDILVIELFNPVYTEIANGAAATLVYEARILENYQGTGLGRVALAQDDTVIPATFDGASLFIDDCPDADVFCLRQGTQVGSVKMGCCYKFPECKPCHGGYQDACLALPQCADGKCGSSVLNFCRNN
jgi:hypothetical protein